MGPNLLRLDGLAGRLGVLGVAAGDLGDGGHHNLGALNLTLDLGKLGLCFFWDNCTHDLPGKTAR